jgi:hypothetical protein
LFNSECELKESGFKASANAFKQIIERRGKPPAIRCDNGPQDVSGAIQN